MASSKCPLCDRKVKLLARTSGAPGNLQRILEAATAAHHLGAGDVAARGMELAGLWHSHLHGEFSGTLPFAEVNAFYARVDALLAAQS